MCHDSSQASERPLVCETLPPCSFGSPAGAAAFFFFAVMADPSYLDLCQRSRFRCLIAAKIGKKVKLYDRFDGILVGHLPDISLDDIFRKLIGGEAVISGVDMTLNGPHLYCIFRASACLTARGPTVPRTRWSERGSS